MTAADLAPRLAALPGLGHIPREEWEWLIAHGDLETREAGDVVAHKGERIEHLYVVLSGHIAILVDRGAGPRRVTEWRTGAVTGILPYSRMQGSPGDTFVEKRAELLAIRDEHFTEMISRCPVFTAHCVHTMLDRARSFNTSDLQDEKMVSLGKLSAGLAHELNNPASAIVRGAKLLLAGLGEADAASWALGAAGPTGELRDTIERTREACLGKPAGDVLSPVQQADRQDEIADWLEDHGSDPALAAPLAETAATVEALDSLAGAASGAALDAALRWIAASCATRSLAGDLERAATRVYELVAAVKRFTYMDNLAGPESVDVGAGLRDTIRIVAAKARSKGATVTLDVQPDLPRAHATGGELNQVWLNLIDNALDAIPDNGRVEISARAELDRVVVHVTDDGPGIPADVVSRIFDPFFTTKPPGEGTGLGLDIARRLLRRYNGEVTVASRPGRTDFRVSLPTEKPSPGETDGVAFRLPRDSMADTASRRTGA